MRIPKLLAFYLPQYHPIPENNAWWGQGFTEWRNVTQATPLFPGHYQPHLPADLGFYDLRLAESRQQQVDLAKKYGLHGFCYYHYWFNGKQLLERPLTEILASGEPDFPFCLCWANENWTRRWDGLDRDILIAQNYSLLDDENHILALLPYFNDPRYIRVAGKPLFLVYRSSLLPNPVATTAVWRKIARLNGIDDLYLVKVESFPAERAKDPALDGFDAALDFQPDWSALPPRLTSSRFSYKLSSLRRFQQHPLQSNYVFSYPEVVATMLSRASVAYPRFPCVTPRWDNSPRRRNGGAVIFIKSTPNAYQTWLEAACNDHNCFELLPEPFVFINAWNEWAEGNHLEPDLSLGHGYLEATHAARSRL